MSQSDRLSTVYASDEDVAVRAAGDFVVLAPAWQKLAQGTDGAFAAGDLWTLSSPSADFQAAGVRPGHVVLLRKPSTAFKGSGELFAIASVSGGSVTLRRIGMDAGLGAPASPSGGLTAVEFLIATLGPQIEEASFELNRRFNIDPNFPGRTPADLRDARDLRRACVLIVLALRYAAETRSDEGDFALKLRQTEAELSEALSRLDVRWGPQGSDRQPADVFRTRIER
ncbi:hypothetical protein [Paludisphaera rhizosphaerae]|uniref:hypothetical protein n=1 Tax=Paludisphaera rhizosphaerae TaxID=2711216 RepID=UPI0013E9A51F|nr:hypothetical protein [Paludisphaera rhizosphaerae]